MSVVHGAMSLKCDLCDAIWVGPHPPPGWRHYQLRRLDWVGTYIRGAFDNFVLCEECACAGEAKDARRTLFQKLFGRRKKV